MRKYGPVWQIFTGMIVGIVLGLLNKQFSMQLKPVGDIFINMIKMAIIPLVASALITSLSGIGDLKTVGKLGAKTLFYFWVVTSIAIVAGVMTVVWTHPGAGVTMEGFQSGAIDSYVQTAKTAKPIDVITGIFPSNVIASAAEGKLLPVVLF
jgi:proton glutamate symport protein